MFPANVVCEPGFDLKAHMCKDAYQIYLQRHAQLKPRFAWSEKLEPLYNGFLIHRSMNVPGKVAYFQNVSNMIANKYTRTSPQMFLSRALGTAPDTIKSHWSVEVCGKLLPTLHFIENDDPEGWQAIYRTGPSSCMSGSPLVQHYAHPDNHLALAYITINNNVIARTIVNREKMQYVRAYISGNCTDEMPSFVAALNVAGFTHSFDALAGEKIHAYTHRCCRCGTQLIRGPYLDGNYQSVVFHKDKDTAIIHAYGDEMNYSHHDEDAHCGCEEGDEWDDDDDDDEEPHEPA